MSRPVHEAIRASLEQEILSGALPPGARLPTETELAARWGCARMTAGRALNALAQAGMVERRRKAGTVVARRTVQQTVLDIHEIAAEVRARGQAYGWKRLQMGQEAAGPLEAERLGLEEGRAVLHVLGLHLADGETHALEERLINLGAAPDAAGEAFEGEPPGAWLLRHVPWAEAEHAIRALAADALTARRMGLSRGAACLSLERRTWMAGRCVTFARFLFPADRQTLVARLRQP